MDIKERIDALTEQEAKAALEYLIDYIAFGNRITEMRNGDIENTRVDVLQMALKGARK